MKQRRPKRRKQFKQPKKRLPTMPPGQASTALPPRPSYAVPGPIGTREGALSLQDQTAGHTEPAPVASVTDPIPQPTLYPAEPGGTVIVQNQITINIHSTDFREFEAKLDEMLGALRRSNEIAGEVRDQLTAEITAGRTLIKAPKVDRSWIDLLLVKPLKYVIEKGGSAVIGKLATAALDWLFKLLS